MSAIATGPPTSSPRFWICFARSTPYPLLQPWAAAAAAPSKHTMTGGRMNLIASSGQRLSCAWMTTESFFNEIP